MGNIARFEVEVCALCGRQRQYGMTAYCRGGIGRQRHERRLYEKVEYVPADTCRGAVSEVERLRKMLAAREQLIGELSAQVETRADPQHPSGGQ